MGDQIAVLYTIKYSLKYCELLFDSLHLLNSFQATFSFFPLVQLHHWYHWTCPCLQGHESFFINNIKKQFSGWRDDCHGTVAGLIDWMVFYTAFNSISVISRRQLTLFMLSWVSPVLGWALKCLAQRHSHEKNPEDPVRLEPRTSRLRVKHFTTEPHGTLEQRQDLAHYHTIPALNDPEKEGLGKHCRKRRKCW